MIAKSFKKCSIINTFDGSEDHYLFEDDTTSSEDPFSVLNESGGNDACDD